MISFIPRLSKDLLSICLMSSSSTLTAMSLRAIKSRFDIHSSFVIEVNKEAELKQALTQVNIAPLLGSRWLLLINIDNLDVKQVQKTIHGYYHSCLVLYSTSLYFKYKQLLADKKISGLASFNKNLYLDRLSQNDIEYVLSQYNQPVSEKLVKLLSDNYSREPDSIVEIGIQLQAGKTFSSKQDLIEAIGLGNVNVANFVVKLLTMQVNTERGLKSSLKRTLSYLNYLYQDIESYSSIKNFILDTISGFIDIKIAMTQGKITHIRVTPPEFQDVKRSKRFARLLRYRFVLEQSVPLERLLKYKLSLESIRGTAQQALLTWLMQIYNAFPAVQSAPVPKIDTRVPLDKPFRLSDYDNYGNFKFKTLKPKKTKAGTVPDSSKSADSAINPCPVCEPEHEITSQELLALLGVPNDNKY